MSNLAECSSWCGCHADDLPDGESAYMSGTGDGLCWCSPECMDGGIVRPKNIGRSVRWWQQSGWPPTTCLLAAWNADRVYLVSTEHDEGYMANRATLKISLIPGTRPHE